MGLPYTMHGVAMKVGSLVRWESADGEYELGIVTQTYGSEAINVMVYFPEDGYPSVITVSDLEVINENANR